MMIIKDFEEELLKKLRRWLPEEIIDSHVHCQPKPMGQKGVFNEVAKYPNDTFAYFTYSQHRKTMIKLLPHFKRHNLIFAFPFSCRETVGNEYVKNIANKRSNIGAVFLAANKINNSAMIEKVIGPNADFKGLKIKIRKSEGGMASILDFCPSFEFLNRKKSFVIIHLPVNLDYSNDELRFLSKRYGDMTFIIAHLGNSFVYQNDLDSALDKMVGLSNVFFDTAMIVDVEVLTVAISILGYRRIFYGSDAPFSYLRGEFNRVGSRVVFDPEICFPWVDKQRYQSYCHKSGSFVAVHIQNLAAIKEAVDKVCPDKNQAKSGIFGQNILSAKIL